jgi:uncharacterized radical SAM superfamily Fe-S cluster-containing enzyme
VKKKGCPYDCGRCPDHGQHACTVLVEITERCNLRCPVCFADAGEKTTAAFADVSTLAEHLRRIHEHAGNVVLQLSGGEPTLHPDLASLVRIGRELFPAVQVNTNGLLLADRPELAEELAVAGLSWVFLQFDGTTDAVFQALRGRPLLERKLAAVENCRKAGLSVVLVPTVARGVNDQDLGNLLRLALRLAPTVRGLHLQPMTGSGRNKLAAGGRHAITLPETLAAICAQSGGLMRPEHATPPGCEHERCSFHCRYRISGSGALVPLRGEGPCCPAPDGGRDGACCFGGAGTSFPQGETLAEDGGEGLTRAIDTILRAWGGAGTGENASGGAEGKKERQGSGVPDALEDFIAKARSRTFSVTCMAFQDVWNVDLARLQGCCVHVFSPPDRLIPFCAYNMTAVDGEPLHRRKER